MVLAERSTTCVATDESAITRVSRSAVSRVVVCRVMPRPCQSVGTRPANSELTLMLLHLRDAGAHSRIDLEKFSRAEPVCRHQFDGAGAGLHEHTLLRDGGH